MNKRHIATPARLLALFAVVALGIFIFLPEARSQDDMKEIKVEVFAPHSRPAAVFLHDEHNEKAGIEDCVTCHHSKDEATGKQTLEEDSVGTPCADCHKVNEGRVPLMRAYHQQCIGCHTSSGKGPTYCGGCHTL